MITAYVGDMVLLPSILLLREPQSAEEEQSLKGFDVVHEKANERV